MSLLQQLQDELLDCEGTHTVDRCRARPHHPQVKHLTAAQLSLHKLASMSFLVPSIIEIYQKGGECSKLTLARLCFKLGLPQHATNEEAKATLCAIRAQITNNILAAIVDYGLPDEIVQKIFHMVVRRNIPSTNVTIIQPLLACKTLLGTSDIAKIFYQRFGQAFVEGTRFRATALFPPRAPFLGLLTDVRHLQLDLPDVVGGSEKPSWRGLIHTPERLSHIARFTPHLKTLVYTIPIRVYAMVLLEPGRLEQQWSKSIKTVVSGVRASMPGVTLGIKFTGDYWCPCSLLQTWHPTAATDTVKKRRSDAEWLRHVLDVTSCGAFHRRSRRAAFEAALELLRRSRAVSSPVVDDFAYNHDYEPPRPTFPDPCPGYTIELPPLEWAA